MARPPSLVCGVGAGKLRHRCLPAAEGGEARGPSLKSWKAPGAAIFVFGCLRGGERFAAPTPTAPLRVVLGGRREPASWPPGGDPRLHLDRPASSLASLRADHLLNQLHAKYPNERPLEFRARTRNSEHRAARHPGVARRNGRTARGSLLPRPVVAIDDSTPRETARPQKKKKRLLPAGKRAAGPHLDPVLRCGGRLPGGVPVSPPS